jgi:hypothetical protein
VFRLSEISQSSPVNDFRSEAEVIRISPMKPVYGGEGPGFASLTRSKKSDQFQLTFRPYYEQAEGQHLRASLGV